MALVRMRRRALAATRSWGRAWGFVVVRGRSMQPTLYDGDRLLVRHGATPREGALVVVRLPGGRGLAVKRATSRRDDGWWVERDNPDEGTDSWLVGAIPEEDVLAVVRLRVRPLLRRGRGRGSRHR